MSSANNRSILASLALSLLSAVALSFESYLKIQGTSLCKTAACEVVGNYLRISESLLVAGGAVFFWLLYLSIFFSFRYPEKLKGTPCLLLLPALAFDGAIIGFQIFTIHQKCLLCLSIAGALIISSVIYCLSQKSHSLLLCCILTWIGGFAASGILDMPEPTQARTQMIFYQQTGATNSTALHQKEITLVFSMNCPHCFEIISYLAEINPKNNIWKFASTDQDFDALQKLAFFIDHKDKTENPFLLLKTVELSSPSHKYDIDTLRYQTKKTLTYLANTGYSSVPLLIVKESPTEEKLLLGTDTIMQFLQPLL